MGQEKGAGRGGRQDKGWGGGEGDGGEGVNGEGVDAYQASRK